LIRHEFIATREDSVLLVIDLQQALLKAVHGWEEILRKVNQLTRAARVLGVPVVVTEQYRKGLGETFPEVLREIEAPLIFQKDHFSACLEPDFLETIRAFRRRTLVVVGIESHVCVLQSCLDLMKWGFPIHVVADAVGSRSPASRDIALDLMRDAGAVISSAETVIFEWARRANTEAFRSILPIVK
jgi:nicotinamidase-related amidase